MALCAKDLEQTAQLAHLEIDAAQTPQLLQEINAIMNFVAQLRAVDTQGVNPLFHPFDLHQPLRVDEVTEASCLDELAALAPLFENDFYLVPKVIESSS